MKCDQFNFAANGGKISASEKRDAKSHEKPEPPQEKPERPAIYDPRLGANIDISL